MTSVRAIVENRVNGLGVSEAVVQQAGDRRILVELPGEKDPEKALETIQKTGLLEFVDFSGLTTEKAVALEGQPVETVDGQTSGSPAGDGAAATVSQLAQENPSPVFHSIMTGAMISTVNVTRSKAGQFEVAFELTPEGAKIFRDFTAQHVGKILAIVLDKRVISAPRINSAIPDGKGVITGNFTLETANNLAVQLRYGSLPIPLKVASTQTVGPTLGKDSLRKSLIAGLIGLSVVIAFMALYYRLPGVLADLALVVYALITFALFKTIPVTLTLPGLAGFVLSLGVAVDANILIFERLKEEIRAGKQLRYAIDLAWKRAWPSIRDSNLSTLITCTILFWFGSNFGASIVKGFSLTLALGVLVSMFTAVIVTRTFLHLVLDNIQFPEHPKWFGI
jgi:preprotein translocase subunit SecD